MTKTILAVALIGFTSIAAAQSQINLSEIPPGAIHTPGIGPGYIFPSYDTQTATTDQLSDTTSLMPGSALTPEQRLAR